MEVKDRIKAILEHYNLTVSEFVVKAKIKTGQAVYDLLSGKTKSISMSMENKILSCFQDLDKVWLLTGEGKMFRDDISISQKVYGDNNHVAGRDLNISSQDVNKLIDTVNKQQETISELIQANQAQMGKFMDMLDRLTK